MQFDGTCSEGLTVIVESQNGEAYRGWERQALHSGKGEDLPCLDDGARIEHFILLEDMDVSIRRLESPSPTQELHRRISLVEQRET
jgi:hypothetical protein